MIKFPPLAPKPVPKRFIIQNGERYTMFSKDGKQLGYMIAGERNYGRIAQEDYEFYPKKENYTSLYIVALFSKVKRQGVGRTFVEIAKRLANNERCQNRVTVLAMNNQDGHILNASSPFFRKCGFSSAEKPGLEDADRVIKGLKPKHGDWYCCLPMYLPIKNKKK